MDPPDKGKRIHSFHERLTSSEERERRRSVILSPRSGGPSTGAELKEFLNQLLEEKTPDALQAHKFYSGAPPSSLNILGLLPKARLSAVREDDSPVYLFPDGGNESEAETVLPNYVAAQSLSTYPRNMKSGKRYGSPNADYYGLAAYRNRFLTVLADGCGWGPDAADCAREATNSVLKYLEQNHAKAVDIYSMTCTLLRGLAHAAASVRRGSTTILAGILAEVRAEDMPMVGSEWVYVCVNIGDCKAFVQHPGGRLRDVTAGNRAGSNSPVDPGGSLASDTHDLRNLGAYYTCCSKDDVLVLVSDGVHDNFDPQQLGFTPQELKIEFDDWETKVHIDVVDKVRTKFRLAVMSQKLTDVSKPEAITQALIQHCVETTRRSRNWMEAHPNHRLPKDYRAFPGKQDHTTCVSIRVARIPIDDQLQFKIDEKMRHLHRKEMQAQIAAKYEEAARARQVLNTALFAKSLSNKSNSASKPPPRLADARQNTFTVLNTGVQAPPQLPIKTHKSRSMVDMRKRQSLDVQPSWTQDPVRASPPRLERSKIPQLRTEIITGASNAEMKPQLAQASSRNKPDPAYLSRADGLVQTDSQGIIRSASIPRIVEQLVLWHRGTDTPAIVNEQRDCFLLCYKLYCTPKQLLDIIRSLYLRQKPAEVSDDAWRRHSSILRAGLADLIARWLSLSYSSDFWAEDGTVNYLLYEQLMETIELFPDDKSPGSPNKHLKDQLPKLAQELPSPKDKEKSDKKPKARDSSKGVGRTFSDLLSKKLPRPEDIKVVDLNVADISEHLTFIDYELFSRVTRQEVLGYSTTRPMSAIRSWQHRGDLVRRWVATEFATTVNAKQRSVVLDRFARIAEKCFEFGNFQCCHAILNGLDHPAVQKLTQHQHVTHSPVFKQLQKAMEGYQEHLSERLRSGKYAIPVLRFYLRRMDEVAKTPATDPERPDNVLFDKMHVLGRIVLEINALQRMPFTKVEDESPNDKTIKMYLMTLDALVKSDREIDAVARQEESNAII